ncbi:GspE/PulE family protein [Undibacterium flavidum]|uniref:Type II/IV secretion system protein n=1 Tax=Undibacterium flavidum TaxID=2762297 RepID=A0ABR6YBX9_9BURK|nr:GspE/PulE family protein [Undibacterium flavidum]MBC3873832.1 type II/IV secretion system protein [Undibacterium flavidum]
MQSNSSSSQKFSAPLSSLLLSARELSRKSGHPLVLELANLAHCHIGDIEQASVSALGVRYFALADLKLVAPQFQEISFTDCVNRGIYPLRMHDGDYFVVNDPWDDQVLQWLANKVGGYPTLAWGIKSDILIALEFAQQRIKVSNELPVVSTSDFSTRHAGAESNVISIATIESSTSPVVRFVDAAIYDAWKAGASDIHFECDRNSVRVKLRLDGVLVSSSELDGRMQAEEVISRIKVLAQLDIAERRIPQDGRFRIELGERELDFRVSIMPSIFGEDAVVRLLDKTQLRGDANDISLVSLGLDTDAIERVRRLAKKPHGMLLVTGPTGSGKTTTLYAALSEIRTGQEKIITIEDPVEYELPGVLQIPVNEKKGLTFSQGLRSILRHDPDKILVGEIRDAETAEIAVQAALTGHLVFTTVHANSVFDVISRFVHMNIDLYSLVSALNGVVAQRLIRRNCSVCSVPETMTRELLDRMDIAKVDVSKASVSRGLGCEHCRNTGYKGRLAIAEVLSFDDQLRAMVLNRADVMEIKRYALSLGIRPLGLRALDLVICGATTLEEIDRVVAHD